MLRLPRRAGRENAPRRALACWRRVAVAERREVAVTAAAVGGADTVVAGRGAGTPVPAYVAQGGSVRAEAGLPRGCLGPAGHEGAAGAACHQRGGPKPSSNRKPHNRRLLLRHARGNRVRSARVPRFQAGKARTDAYPLAGENRAYVSPLAWEKLTRLVLAWGLEAAGEGDDDNAATCVVSVCAAAEVRLLTEPGLVAAVPGAAGRPLLARRAAVVLARALAGPDDAPVQERGCLAGGEVAVAAARALVARRAGHRRWRHAASEPRGGEEQRWVRDPQGPPASESSSRLIRDGATARCGLPRHPLPRPVETTTKPAVGPRAPPPWRRETGGAASAASSPPRSRRGPGRAAGLKRRSPSKYSSSRLAG